MHIEKHIVDNKFPRKSSPCFTRPCFTSPVHGLQVQSMFYKSSPIQGPVHVLQHASRPANHSSKSLSTKSTRKLLFDTLSSLKFAKIHKQQYLDEN